MCSQPRQNRSDQSGKHPLNTPNGQFTDPRVHTQARGQTVGQMFLLKKFNEVCDMWIMSDHVGKLGTKYKGTSLKIITPSNDRIQINKFDRTNFLNGSTGRL